MNSKQLKVALYIRTNNKSNDAIKTQENSLLQVCDNNDYLIYDFYIDKNCNGDNSNRLEYNRMLEDMKANKFDLILTYSLDRITRSIEELNCFKSLVTNSNCDFRTIKESLDLYCLNHLMLVW